MRPAQPPRGLDRRWWSQSASMPVLPSFRKSGRVTGSHPFPRTGAHPLREFVMRTSGLLGLSAVLAAGAIAVPLVASATAGAVVNTVAAPAVGKQLAELKGSDTVTYDTFGQDGGRHLGHDGDCRCTGSRLSCWRGVHLHQDRTGLDADR
jgi:hypothetical protein